MTTTNYDTNYEYMTQELACALWSYDEATGLLKWKIRPSQRTKKGYEVTSMNPDGYYTVRAMDKSHLAHRIVWLMKTEKWPDGIIDHIDGNPSNNRFDNLRDVDSSTNNFNRQKVREGAGESVCYPGVSWNEPMQRWVVKHGSRENRSTPQWSMPSLLEAMCLKKRLQAGGNHPIKDDMKKGSPYRKFLESNNV